MVNADLVGAIEQRISCRAYANEPIATQALERIRDETEACAGESGVRFCLHVPSQDGSNIALSPKMFAGQPFAYLTCVGPDDARTRELVGYFGERIVLCATALGVGSCWVAGTFDRSATTCDIPDGEALHDVIPLGVPMASTPLKQRSIRKAIRAKSKRKERMYEGPTSLADAPQWIRAAIDAVWKGPSAVNEQPVVFVQESADAPVRTELPRFRRDLEHTDLGIAKLHFLLGAAAHARPGTWEWGVGGTYRTE